MQLKEENINKKHKVNINFNGIQEEFKNLEIGKRVAENMLNTMKQQLFDNKKTIETLTSTKLKKVDEGKTYLATEKLAFAKKTGDKSSNSSNQTPRKSKKSR